MGKPSLPRTARVQMAPGKQSLCVVCGAEAGVDPRFEQIASCFGRAIGERGHTLVYGGGPSGIMGSLADACLAVGGRVIGVVPELFLRQPTLTHQGLSELLATPDFHTRKRRMTELADSFIILPGGFGTLDEFFEIFTWRTYQLHTKPIVLLNFLDYWNPLLELLNHAVNAGFARPEFVNLIRVAETIDCIFDFLAAAPTRRSDIGLDQT